MKALIFLSFCMFSIGSSTFMIAGLLPQISTTIKESVTLSSQGITLFNLFYLLSALTFSLLVSHRSAKSMILYALSLFLIGNLITLISSYLSVFLFGRTLAGIGAGVFTPLCLSSAFHFVKDHYRGRILSMLWGANSAGVVFGVPLGLILSESIGWQCALLSTILIGTLGSLGFWWIKTDFIMPQSDGFHQKISALKDPQILSVLMITGLTTMVGLGLYSFVTDLHRGSPHSLSLALFMWGIGGFLGSSFVGLLIDRFKDTQYLMCFIILGLMYVFIILPITKATPYLGLIPFFFWGLFGWATTAPQQHTLLNYKKEQAASLIALNSSAIGLGSALGTILGTSLMAYGHGRVTLPFFGALLLFGALIYQITLLKNQHRRLTYESSNHHH